jgi:membrane protein required for colicin V production
MLSLTDIVIIAIGIAACVRGAWSGFIAQIGSLIAILAAIVSCQVFGDTVAQWLDAPIVVAWVLLFVAVYLGVVIVSRMVRGVSRAMHLGTIDRIGGGLFYLFKWLVVASLLINIWLVFSPQSTISHGVVASTVKPLSPRLLGHVTQYVGNNNAEQ